jgi:hypothetical protein
MTLRVNFALHCESLLWQFCWKPFPSSPYNRHDFNHELGGKAFADIRPDWQTESIMDEWAHYAQSPMGGCHMNSV